MLAVSGNFKGAALDNQVGSQVVCPLDGVDAGAIATGKSIESISTCNPVTPVADFTGV